MKTLYQDLFTYNHYFNHELSDIFIKTHDTINEKPITLFSHILNAHHIWNSRIIEKQSEYDVWKVHSIPELKKINENNFNNTQSILTDFDLDKTILYKNSKGQKFKNKISEILFHIINHSTYHRGQIASSFRQNNIEPLNTDYIFYKR